MKNLRILVLFVIVLSLVLAACGSAGSTTQPTTSSASEGDPAAGSTTQPPTSSASEGDPAAGKTAYASLSCRTCHGDNAQGKIGPRLAGFGLIFDQFEKIVRNGKDGMPASDENVVSDQQLTDIYAWLKADAQD